MGESFPLCSLPPTEPRRDITVSETQYCVSIKCIKKHKNLLYWEMQEKTINYHILRTEDGLRILLQLSENQKVIQKNHNWPHTK